MGIGDWAQSPIPILQLFIIKNNYKNKKQLLFEFIYN